MKTIKARAAMAVLLVGVYAYAAGFEHELAGRKPWTSEAFLDDPQEFHFAIIPDRTGGERRGVFGKAIATCNLLRPEFVMSVGDLIAGGGRPEPELRKQWEDLEGHLAKLEMPFFHVVGNHDIWTGFTGMSPARATSIKLWHEFRGERTYYSFRYKGCLFICLDSMETANYFPPREALSETQLDWAAKEMERYPEVRWRFVFMHKPLDWTSDRWLAFERRVNTFDFTVFCGDWHNHCTAIRHGKKYYMIGTAGGGFDLGATTDDLRQGIMDSITWVTMTKKGPVVSHLALSGVHGDTIQRCATTKGWIEAPLDYPSHRTADPATYAGEKNTALIPTEREKGDGYDWHQRHGVILRQARCYSAGIEEFGQGKKRVILLGDETASACAPAYEKEYAVLDLGFKGDRTEHVLWRIGEGELDGYEADRVVIAVGRYNANVNTPDEIAAAVNRIETIVRAHCPKAVVETRR